MAAKERGGGCDTARYQKTTTIGFPRSTSEIATSTRPRPCFTLKLQGRGDAADIRSLRWILKSLLRRYGWRCLDCREERRP
jgi:hypothetical protein